MSCWLRDGPHSGEGWARDLLDQSQTQEWTAGRANAFLQEQQLIPHNEVFTILATVSCGRLTGLEQTENNRSLSR